MAGVSPSHWLLPDWDPGLTIAHLPLPHLTGRDIQAAVIDVDRTLLPGRAVRLPDSVRVWLEDAGRRLQLHLFSNNPSKARISAVASQLDLSFTCGAGKPRRGALRRVIADLDLPPRSIADIASDILDLSQSIGDGFEKAALNIDASSPGPDNALPAPNMANQR